MMFSEEFFEVSLDSITLRGVVHFPGNSQPKGIVISSHGYNGERVDTHRILVKNSRNLAVHGFLSVRFDHRGCGLSDGDFWTSTPKIRERDVIAVIDFFANRHKGSPLILHGFSDGCRVIAGVASLIRPYAIVLWSPILFAFSSSGEPGAIPPWERHPDDRSFVRPFLGHWMGSQYLSETSKSPDLEIDGIPTLIVRGANDIDVNSSVDYLLANSAVVDLIEIPKTGHIYASPSAEELVIQRTGTWIESKTRRSLD
jgi:pimeloyl-ACP methyl ester carboxylesterase